VAIGLDGGVVWCCRLSPAKKSWGRPVSSLSAVHSAGQKAELLTCMELLHLDSVQFVPADKNFKVEQADFQLWRY